MRGHKERQGGLGESGEMTRNGSRVCEGRGGGVKQTGWLQQCFLNCDLGILGLLRSFIGSLS